MVGQRLRARQFITAGTQQAACLQERKAQICLMRKMEAEKDAKGSSEKAFFCQDEKMFSYKLADFDLTLIVGMVTFY